MPVDNFPEPSTPPVDENTQRNRSGPGPSLVWSVYRTSNPELELQAVKKRTQQQSSCERASTTACELQAFELQAQQHSSCLIQERSAVSAGSRASL